MQKVSWYVPNYVLYAYHAGILIQEELEEADHAVVEILRSNPQRQIILVSDHRHVIENKVPVYKMANMLNFANEPNLQMVLSIQTNQALVFMGKIFTQVMGLKYQFANTLESGISLLQREYPDLPWEDADEFVLQQDAANV